MSNGLKVALVGGLLVSGAIAVAHPEIDSQIARLDAEIADRPQEPELYLRRGELHRIHRSWAAAEADFLAARKIDAGLAAVDFHLGRLQLETGRYYLRAAGRRIRRNLAALWDNDDEQTTSLANRKLAGKVV